MNCFVKRRITIVGKKFSFLGVGGRGGVGEDGRSCKKLVRSYRV